MNARRVVAIFYMTDIGSIVSGFFGELLLAKACFFSNRAQALTDMLGKLLLFGVFLQSCNIAKVGFHESITPNAPTLDHALVLVLVCRYVRFFKEEG